MTYLTEAVILHGSKPGPHEASMHLPSPSYHEQKPGLTFQRMEGHMQQRQAILAKASLSQPALS